MEVSKISRLKGRSQQASAERPGSQCVEEHFVGSSLMWPTVRNNVTASNKVFRPVFWANCDPQCLTTYNTTRYFYNPLSRMVPE